MKTLRELQAIFAESTTTVHSRVAIACNDIFCSKKLDDCTINVLSNGYIVYRTPSRSTAFKLSDCLSFHFHLEESNSELTYEDFADQDWVIWACLYGEQRIEKNSDNEYAQHVLGMRRTDPLTATEYLNDKLDEAFYDSAPTPEDRQQALASFEELIAPLNDRYKDFCWKYYWNGLSLDEIAKQYHCSYHAIENLSSRVKKKLRQHYTQS